MRLIDADALKADYGMKDNCKDCEKELRGYVRQCEYDAVYTKMDFCGWIDSMPTIEPQRKTGEWITSDDMYETGICSCCRYDTQEPVSYVITNFVYCPNCGAKMGEGEQDG